MSQPTLSHAIAGERAAAPAGLLRFLPWVFVCLGVLAPLVLVIAAAMGSDSSADRAQMIVHGVELLTVSLLFTVVLSLIYVMGMREATLITAPRPRTLNGITTA
jgi:hypothetical protein